MIDLFIAAGVLIVVWLLVTRLAFWSTIGIDKLTSPPKAPPTGISGAPGSTLPATREEETAAHIRLALRGLKKK